MSVPCLISIILRVRVIALVFLDEMVFHPLVFSLSFRFVSLLLNGTTFTTSFAQINIYAYHAIMVVVSLDLSSY